MSLASSVQVKNLDTGEEVDISDNDRSGSEGSESSCEGGGRKSTLDEEQALLKSIATAFFDLAPKTIKACGPGGCCIAVGSPTPPNAVGLAA